MNVRGREPEGCVDPGEEYERVREQVTEILLGATDPATGRPAANLACRREDAAMLGVGGDRAGDRFLWREEQPVPPMTRAVFEAQNPGVDLGSWEWSRHDSGHHRPDPFMIFAGSGTRRGYRRDRASWINRFAPTVATARGIPVPRDADRGAMADVFA